MKLFSIIIWLMIVTAGSVHAHQQYILTHYSNDNGLPVTGVVAMEWDDHNQLLWLGTQGGLVCWDGQQFTRNDKCTDRINYLQKITTRGQTVINVQTDQFLFYQLNGLRCDYVGKSDKPLSRIPTLNKNIRDYFVRIDQQTNSLGLYNFIMPVGNSNDKILLIYQSQIFLRQGREIKIWEKPGSLLAFSREGRKFCWQTTTGFLLTMSEQILLKKYL